MKKRVLFIVSLLMIAAILAGCSSATKNDSPQYGGTADYNSSIGEDMAPAAPGDYLQEPQKVATEGSYGGDDDLASTADNKNVDVLEAQMGSKIIKSGYLSMETLEFEETTSEISRRVQQAGGFTASSNVQGWSRADANYKPMRKAHYKIRIPSERFEQFITDLEVLGNVTRNETWGEDVSAKYFDTEARLKTLEMQEERLLTILSKAEVLADIIELERELTSVRYEIENLTGTLRKYDNLIAYSTLELDVIEVEEITEIEAKPVTLWDKIVRSFNDSINNVARIAEGLLLFLIGAIPFLLLLGIIILILFGIARLLSKKTRTNTQNTSAPVKAQVRDEEKKE